MKTMFQVGLNERVPVPPEKRFLIHLIGFVLLTPALAMAQKTLMQWDYDQGVDGVMKENPMATAKTPKNPT